MLITKPARNSRLYFCTRDNMIDQTYNNLTVLNLLPNGINRRKMCICICACGKLALVRRSALISGEVKSCGCLKGTVKHGYIETPTYKAWKAMRQKCSNPNHRSYNKFGGMGISVAKEWEDFSKFLSDMGERPKNKRLTRIDKTKDFSRDNCRWEGMYNARS